MCGVLKGEKLTSSLHHKYVPLNTPLYEQFGNLDIYIFDQLLKGQMQKEHHILDAACGQGRNHYYFVKEGYKLQAFDRNEEAMAIAVEQAEMLGYATKGVFQKADMVQMPYADETFDWVMNIAVLHFAENPQHFEAMLMELYRVCKTGGRLLIRLATDIGIPHLLQPLGHQRFLLPDGSERFVATEADLLRYTEQLGAVLFEPIKTTNVQNLRCMTTWCLQKQ